MYASVILVKYDLKKNKKKNNNHLSTSAQRHEIILYFFTFHCYCYNLSSLSSALWISSKMLCCCCSFVIQFGFMANLLDEKTKKTNKKKTKQKMTLYNSGQDTKNTVDRVLWDSWPWLVVSSVCWCGDIECVCMSPVQSSLQEECMPSWRRLFNRVKFICSDCSSLA